MLVAIRARKQRNIESHLSGAYVYGGSLRDTLMFVIACLTELRGFYKCRYTRGIAGYIVAPQYRAEKFLPSENVPRITREQDLRRVMELGIAVE